LRNIARKGGRFQSLIQASTSRDCCLAARSISPAITRPRCRERQKQQKRRSLRTCLRRLVGQANRRAQLRNLYCALSADCLAATASRARFSCNSNVRRVFLVGRRCPHRRRASCGKMASRSDNEEGDPPNELVVNGTMLLRQPDQSRHVHAARLCQSKEIKSLIYKIQESTG
jgi:hypothetical protein